MSRMERLKIVDEIAERLHVVYGEQILAIGLYGSTARGEDGPYSDIEMFCVLRESEESVDLIHEWSTDAWTAAVDVCNEGALLEKASSMTWEWPLSHGPYFNHLGLYDPEGFFPKLKEAAQSLSAEDFRVAVSEVIACALFEYTGKLRNANLHGPASYLPYLAMEIAKYGAYLLGLHHRKIFSSGAKVLPEALELPNRPRGFDQVAAMVMSGRLDDGEHIFSACEQFWSGLTEWAKENEYRISSERRIPF